jgi:hypothetical protein
MDGGTLRRFGWSKVFSAVRCNVDTESSAGEDVKRPSPGPSYVKILCCSFKLPNNSDGEGLYSTIKTDYREKSGYAYSKVWIDSCNWVA